MQDTICAVSTSLGVGAISIVRVSGPDTVKIVNKIFDSFASTNVTLLTLFNFSVSSSLEASVLGTIAVKVLLEPSTV